MKFADVINITIEVHIPPTTPEMEMVLENYIIIIPVCVAVSLITLMLIGVPFVIVYVKRRKSKSRHLLDSR